MMIYRDPHLRQADWPRIPCYPFEYGAKVMLSEIWARVDMDPVADTIDAWIDEDSALDRSREVQLHEYAFVHETLTFARTLLDEHATVEAYNWLGIALFADDYEPLNPEDVQWHLEQ